MLVRALSCLALIVTAACGDDAASMDGGDPARGGTGGGTGGAAPGAGSSGAAPSGGTAATPSAGAGAGAAPGAGAGGTGGGGAPGDAGTQAPTRDAGAATDAGASGSDAGQDAAASAICPTGASFGAPLPAGATATLVMGGFDFIEGPVWHAGLGVLFFSDMDFANQGADGAASRIHRHTPPSSFDVFVPSSGSNGLALDLSGDILAATHDAQTLSTFDAETGARSTMSLDYMGDSFHSVNDVTVRSDGNVYFTDPDWQLPPRAPEIAFTGVYRLAPGGAIELVDDSLDKPNGIALSPDEQTLYVGQAGNDVMRYAVSADGSVGTGSVFISPGPSDGFAVDCAGNLYVTSGGAVRVYDPAGTELGSIAVAEEPANSAFGGPERKTLYITARTGLYSIELNVPGYPY